MGFPGVWMTESEILVYRVVPKCACSTIGQILWYTDHGSFYDGDIHDAETGLHKWARDDSKPRIEEVVLNRRARAFTCVRNPYSRVLSSFFDKICGIQRTGKRYRGNMVPLAAQHYGIEVGGPDGTEPFDQIASFRRFLLFARDTIRWRKPMDPDIHWSSVSGHVGTFIANGGRYDRIFWTERFDEGMAAALEGVEVAHPIALADVPRFNESSGHGPKREHAVEDYFDDLAMHLVYEIYKQDFELFGYDPATPGDRAPKVEIDLDRVHAMLGE